MPKLDVASLQQCYEGFFIKDPVGNNSFSFSNRKNKEIFVAPLVVGNVDDLGGGDRIVFSEVENGQEINRTGLKNFIYLKQNEKDIFIFDNHNHAFFFWLAGALEDRITSNSILWHVDQHRDMREPGRFLDHREGQLPYLKEVFEYTNFELNVGNFIKPAQVLGVFKEVEMITSLDDFTKDVPDNSVLDIDMDLFAPEMNYISYDLKISQLKKWIQKSRFITIATSPYFMDQTLAIEIVKELLAI